MTRPYHYDKQFRKFVRSICGLVFVPLDQLDRAMELLAGVTFSDQGRFYSSIVDFKAKLLDYMDRVWMK